MAGQLNVPESDVIHRRIINVATALRDAAEEIARLKSDDATFNFATNLEEPSFGQGGLTKAEVIAFVSGPMFDFDDFWANATVPFDTADGGSERRDKINPLLLAEPLS